MQSTQTERMALNAAITRATTARRRTRKPSAAPPFPTMRMAHKPVALYWLGAWMRDQAKVEAMDKHAEKQWARADPMLQLAFCAASRLLEKDAAASLSELVDKGVLLFAWHGTTALDNAQVQP